MRVTPDEIRQLRLSAGLTQQQAAMLVGLSDGRCWRAYELGEYAIRPVTWETFKREVKTKCRPKRKTY